MLEVIIKTDHHTQKEINNSKDLYNNNGRKCYVTYLAALLTAGVHQLETEKGKPLMAHQGSAGCLWTTSMGLLQKRQKALQKGSGDLFSEEIGKY